MHLEPPKIAGILSPGAFEVGLGVLRYRCFAATSQSASSAAKLLGSPATQGSTASVSVEGPASSSSGRLAGRREPLRLFPFFSPLLLLCAGAGSAPVAGSWHESRVHPGTFMNSPTPRPSSDLSVMSSSRDDVHFLGFADEPLFADHGQLGRRSRPMSTGSAASIGVLSTVAALLFADHGQEGRSSREIRGSGANAFSKGASLDVELLPAANGARRPVDSARRLGITERTAFVASLKALVGRGALPSRLLLPDAMFGKGNGRASEGIGRSPLAKGGSPPIEALFL